MRRVARFIAMVGLSARVVSGQANEALGVLALPEGRPIICRVPDADSAHPLPPAVIAREFKFGTVTDGRLFLSRWIEVGFDSAGRTLVLTDEATFGIRGSQTVLGVFDSTGVFLIGTRIDITVDSAAQDRAIARDDIAGAQAAIRPPVTRALSPDERKQLSTLGAWLWTRRCGK